jgi:hypothetical protein
MRLLLPAAALLLALLAACVGDPVSGPPQSSGIEGQVLLGPQCPVQQAASPCPDKPYVATVDVYTADRKTKVATFTSDANGHYRVGLLPGDYYIDPQPPDPSRPLPVAAPQTATVQSMKWTEVTITYDTGIR